MRLPKSLPAQTGLSDKFFLNTSISLLQSNLLPLLCLPTLPCLLLLLCHPSVLIWHSTLDPHLERSHLFVLLVPGLMLAPCTWSWGALENPKVALGAARETCVALVNEGTLNPEVMTAMPNYLLK